MARLFGYASVLLTGLLVAWGYVIFRGRRSRALPLFSGLILLLVPLLAASFGWIGVVFEATCTPGPATWDWDWPAG
ncbi:hypothetical protein [Rhodothermus marinus]|uniref:hypothetical protein n=1 Tax=Rhodothermus marinus TaxID=29549 RepID=UPI0006D00863|nr:hypothetical protein [Rhodothermus marinus]